MTTRSQLERSIVDAREMARLRSDPVAVPPVPADEILAFWHAGYERAAESSFQQHERDLHEGVTAWLQRCEAAGWRLVPS